MSDRSKASNEVKNLLTDSVAAYGDDPLGLIIVLSEFMDLMAGEVQDPDVSFARKFQIVADLSFLCHYLENVLISYSAEELHALLEEDEAVNEQYRIFQEVLKYVEKNNGT